MTLLSACSSMTVHTSLQATAPVPVFCTASSEVLLLSRCALFHFCSRVYDYKELLLSLQWDSTQLSGHSDLGSFTYTHCLQTITTLCRDEIISKAWRNFVCRNFLNKLEAWFVVDEKIWFCCLSNEYIYIYIYIYIYVCVCVNEDVK
jgi:hypothetical protein